MNCPLCSASATSEVLVAEGWSVQACSVCTNAWTSPPPARIHYEDEDFHAQFVFRTAADLPPQWRAALLKQADLLTRQLPGGARILEIGCGQGLLLGELKRRGLNVAGVEPSRSAAAAARDAGLEVITGYFPSVLPPGSFDAVIMSHVLEHVNDPLALLRQISLHMPGALMLLVQTNWRGLMPRYLGEKWYAWVPDQHFWHFSPRGLERLIGRLGWKALRIEYSSLEHGRHLLSRGAQLLPGQADQFHLLARIGG